MLKPEQVPDEVVAALQPLLDEEDAPMLRYLVAAALSAWPGMMIHTRPIREIILPLTHEASDE